MVTSASLQDLEAAEHARELDAKTCQPLKERVGVGLEHRPPVLLHHPWPQRRLGSPTIALAGGV